MKFKLLSNGQKFVYNGETYIKTSPLIASNIKTGQNKMIPRYAILSLLNDSATATTTKQRQNKSVTTQEALNAFNTFYKKCITTLENNNALTTQIKDELNKARDEFMQKVV